jgi:hypothetical protein
LEERNEYLVDDGTALRSKNKREIPCYESSNTNLAGSFAASVAALVDVDVAVVAVDDVAVVTDVFDVVDVAVDDVAAVDDDGVCCR